MTVKVSNNLRSDIEKWISDYVGSGKIPFGHVIICDSKDIWRILFYSSCVSHLSENEIIDK